jgi:SAM-dependent methyltransferase
VTSAYDAIARLYDPWSRSVTEDIAFYVQEAALATPGPIVELGVGTGRIAVPVAASGVSVIGIDSSQGMLDVCRHAAELAAVTDRIDLRLGDYREPPVEERVGLVLCPFRAYLHLHTDSERLEALRAAHALLVPGGRLVFDVFTPGPDDIAETNGRWLEREPGIFERADWDEEHRVLTLALRGPDDETTMALSWISQTEWQGLLVQAGFDVEACYGWFDRRPWAGEDDSVWLARRVDIG